MGNTKSNQIETPYASVSSETSEIYKNKIREQSLLYNKKYLNIFKNYNHIIIYRSLYSTINKSILNNAKNGFNYIKIHFSYLSNFGFTFNNDTFDLIKDKFIKELNKNILNKLKLHYISYGYKITKIDILFAGIDIDLEWNSEKPFENINDDDECITCFHKTKNLLYCGHRVHPECFLKQKTHNCPVCQK